MDNVYLGDNITLSVMNLGRVTYFRVDIEFPYKYHTSTVLRWIRRGRRQDGKLMLYWLAPAYIGKRMTLYSMLRILGQSSFRSVHYNYASPDYFDYSGYEVLGSVGGSRIPLQTFRNIIETLDPSIYDDPIQLILDYLNDTESLRS